MKEYRVSVMIEEVEDSNMDNPVFEEDVVYTAHNLKDALDVMRGITAFCTTLEELLNG